MSTSTTPPVIAFQNSLAYDVDVYDSFDDEPQTDDDAQTDADSNYFGTFTKLGSVSANSTGNIQLIHTSSTFIVESAKDNKPVKRCIKLGSKKTLLSFPIVQQDEDNMTKTFKFIDFMLANPKDLVATAFNALWKNTDSNLAPDVDDFFAKQSADHNTCTFQDYMIGITYKAKNPDNVPRPVQETTYSLSQLIKLMGGTWPDGLPDISLFGSSFNADVSMVINNEEAEIGVVIEGNNSSLPAPPIMKGIHFDQIGVGIGVFFEPPGYALGIQGKFHIGDPSGLNVVDLNNDTFVLICKMDGGIPEPVYISFYVPKMDINKVVELFTNTNLNMVLPVEFSDRRYFGWNRHIRRWSYFRMSRR